jgi:dihydroorotase-like cyclic amidohydrolase
MAPFFGFAAGGGAALLTVYMYVAVIGVLAAIAIPSFMKYQERSKAAALLGGPLGQVDAPLDTPPVDDAQAQKNLDELLKNLQQQNAALAQPADDAQAGGMLGALPVDDAPAVDTPPPPAPRFEAKSWLKGQMVAKNKTAVAGTTTLKALALVDKLEKSGAKVFVSDVNVDDEGMYASEIVAVLPEKPLLRKKVVDLCTLEYKKQGYEDPCVDDTETNELFIHWGD